MSGSRTRPSRVRGRSSCSAATPDPELVAAHRHPDHRLQPPPTDRHAREAPVGAAVRRHAQQASEPLHQARPYTAASLYRSDRRPATDLATTTRSSSSPKERISRRACVRVRSNTSAEGSRRAREPGRADDARAATAAQRRAPRRSPARPKPRSCSSRTPCSRTSGRSKSCGSPIPFDHAARGTVLAHPVERCPTVSPRTS